jgi:hypothetical protein
MSTCEQEREYEECADRIVHKKVRTRDDEPALGTSQSRHYDYARSKSSIIDSYKKISYEALIHEHDFVQITPKKGKNVECLTCGAYFCEVCGKLLDVGHIHTDRRKCLALIQRIFL